MFISPNTLQITQKEGIVFNKSKIFDLEEQDKKFKLKISINEQLIYLEIEKINLFPKKDFNIYLSLEELGKINKFFLQFDRIEEVYVSLETLIETKNISVIEEERAIKLKINNPANKKELFIDIPLKEKDLKSEINSINNYISSLVNKVNELEKKVNDLCLFKEEYINNKKKKNENFKDSDIIQKDDVNLILSWLNRKSLKTNLLFNSKYDGDLMSTFFKKVENKSPTFVVIKSSNGYRFGGYTSIVWKCNGTWYKNDESFIFSFNTKQKYNAINSTSSHIFGYKDYFQFGNDIRIYDKFTSGCKNFISNTSYHSPKNYELNGGTQYFNVLNCEVYEII